MYRNLKICRDTAGEWKYSIANNLGIYEQLWESYMAEY